MAHVYGRELSVDLLVVIVDPLPHGSLLGVQLGLHQPRYDAVARAEDIFADDALEGQLLAPLLALDEETQLLRQCAQCLNHIPRRIAARTARAARHALAAIPDRIAFQQLLDGIVVTRLHDIDDLTGIVVVELGRGAYARADTAVHARVKALLHPYVLHQHIEIFSHNLTFLRARNRPGCNKKTFAVQR